MSEIVFVSGGDGRLGMMAEILYENYYFETARSMSAQAEICAPFVTVNDETSENAEKALKEYGYDFREKWQRKLQPGFVMAARQLIIISETDENGRHNLNAPLYIDTTNPNTQIWPIPKQTGNLETYVETFEIIEESMRQEFGEPLESALEVATEVPELVIVKTELVEVA